MALCCLDPRRQIRVEMKRDLNIAVSQYQKAVHLQEQGFHRDAYLWYMRSGKSLDEYRYKYLAHADINRIDKVKELVAELKKRLPICGQFCLEELKGINQKVRIAFSTQKTAYLEVTLQYIFTNFDRQVHYEPLSDRRREAVYPDILVEYSDDSDDAIHQKSKRSSEPKRTSTNAPQKVPARRPKRPRIEGKKFKELMAAEQTWDSVKKLVSTEVLPIVWCKIIGYDQVKRFLSSDFVLHIERQETQPSEEQSNKSIILYGPPGTGKTRFCHGIAYEATRNISIFVDSSKIKSKWSGQAEQNIANVFDMAHALRPSILIFDECEHLMGDREAENNSSSDISGIMLAKMTTFQSSVSVVAATNFPWAVDKAFMRRFSKKIYIGLPKESERAVMLKYHLGQMFNLLTDDDYKALAKKTEGWTGSDIQTLGMNINSYFQVEQDKATHFKFCDIRKDRIVYCPPSDAEDVTQASAHELPVEDLDFPAFTIRTVKKMLDKVKPVVTPEMLKKYREFHGSDECF